MRARLFKLYVDQFPRIPFMAGIRLTFSQNLYFHAETNKVRSTNKLSNATSN